MANVLSFSTSGDNFVWKSIGTQAEAYVTFDIYIPAATFAAGFIGSLGLYTRNGDPYVTGVIEDGVGLLNFPPVTWYLDSGAHVTTSSTSLDAWHTVSIHWKQTLNYPSLQIDGTPYTPNSGITYGDPVDGFIFGSWNGSSTGLIYMRNMKIGTSGYGSSELFSADGSSTAPFTSTQGSISSVTNPSGGVLTTPQGVCIAFSDPTLEPTPAWTRIDSTANLVASWTVDRGRSYELDQNDTGRATVAINDVDGILDPLNASGPYYGLIEPLKQIALARWNPVTSAWSTRFRGFVESYDYTEHPSQKVMQLVIQCVDGFEILSAVEMAPGLFGTTPVEAGTVFYEDAEVDDRIIELYTDAGWPSALATIFSGNIWVQETTYSAGESILTAMLEAADAEFPGVANVYISKDGKLTFHGRYARFDPVGVAAGATPGAWNFTHWKCGDSAAVTGSPSDTAQIRGISFQRGLAKIINAAQASPMFIARNLVVGQIYSDATSITLYGVRSWSAQDLILEGGKTSNVNDGNAEALLYAQYYVENFKDPKNRIGKLVFKSLAPHDSRATPLWNLLCNAEISDMIDVTVGHPGGGGFTGESFFIEGFHETEEPSGDPNWNMVTVELDVSPQGYYAGFPGGGVVGIPATHSATGKAGTVVIT